MEIESYCEHFQKESKRQIEDLHPKCRKCRPCKFFVNECDVCALIPLKDKNTLVLRYEESAKRAARRAAENLRKLKEGGKTGRRSPTSTMTSDSEISVLPSPVKPTEPPNLPSVETPAAGSQAPAAVFFPGHGVIPPWNDIHAIIETIVAKQMAAQRELQLPSVPVYLPSLPGTPTYAATPGKTLSAFLSAPCTDQGQTTASLGLSEPSTSFLTPPRPSREKYLSLTKKLIIDAPPPLCINLDQDSELSEGEISSSSASEVASPIKERQANPDKPDTPDMLDKSDQSKKVATDFEIRTQPDAGHRTADITLDQSTLQRTSLTHSQSMADMPDKSDTPRTVKHKASPSEMNLPSTKSRRTDAGHRTPDTGHRTPPATSVLALVLRKRTSTNERNLTFW